MDFKTKFAIGCLIQWYEVDIIGEYIETLREARHWEHTNKEK
jgi:hypothetical protein